MKKHLSVCVLLTIVSLVACKKEAELTGSSIVEFTATTYQTLGTSDTTGKPNYLVTKDAISPNLLSFVSNTLPEQTDLRKSNPELLTTKAIADIVITQSADVFITFISQNTGFANTFAFYTYPTGNPPSRAQDIKTVTYVFPNSGGGTSLQAGDKVKLGRFEPGTSIGFVLLQNAWDKTKKVIDTKAVHFCSNDVLNPENNPALKKHAVLINYPSENKTIIGFEDLDRNHVHCDHDFNDVLFYATVAL